MNLFYTADIFDDSAFLDEGESRHCVKVLRMKEGGLLHFIDGKGGKYTGQLLKADPKRCKIRILEKKENFEKRPYYLHMAIAPTKNNDRFEWFLEKAAEIGIDRITPLICDHSERRKIRMDRFERIILSAVKQSLKAYLPVLNPLVDFQEFILSEHQEKEFYIAHCHEQERKKLIKEAGKGNSFLILIGPEGDFSETEIQLAIKNGFTPVTLGAGRLRTETAGVAGVQIISDVINLKQ